MNLSKGVAALGLAIVLVVGLTACGGKSSTKTPPAQLVITPTQLPQAVVNSPYATNVNATGGTGTYTWCVFESNGACDNGAGVLPAGITMNTTNSVISGTATSGVASYPFKVQVKDGAGTTATANLSIYVEGSLILSPGGPTLPTGSVNVPYTYPDGSPVQ